MINRMKTHKVKYGIFLAVLLLAAGIIFLVFFRKGNNHTQARKTMQNTISLSKQTLSESISATGTVESNQSKTVFANVNGLTVKQVKVKVGDKVVKGQTLLTFDQEDLQENLSEAESNLDDVRTENAKNISQAQTALSDARSSYASDRAKAAKNVKNTKAQAESCKKQVKALKTQIKKAGEQEKKALQESLEKAQQSLQQAEESYENAKSNQEESSRQSKSAVTQAENALDNAKTAAAKNLKEAKKQKKQAKEALAEAKVKAPINGVVTKVNTEEGDNYTGGTLVQIDDISSFTVTAYIDEYDISKVQAGQKVVILTEATGEEEIEGEITFVALSTGDSSTGDAASGAMGNTSSSDGYEVTIAVTGQAENLRMGLTAKCSIVLKQAVDVYAVPYDAVHKNENGEDVIYVVKESSNMEDYSEVVVTKGMESDYYVEVSGDALEEGMNVMIPTDETESTTEDSDTNNLPFGMGGNMGGAPGGDKGNFGNRGMAPSNGNPEQRR